MNYFIIPDNSIKLINTYFKNKDYESLFSLLSKISKSIISKALKGTEYIDEIEDLSQDVMLEMWKQIINGRIFFSEGLLSYLKKMCKYTVQNYLRKVERRNRILLFHEAYLHEERSRKHFCFDWCKSPYREKRRRKKPLKTIYVYDVETGELSGVYDSLDSASIGTMADKGNISRVLRNVEGYHSTKGFVFSYSIVDKKPVIESSKMG